MYQLQIEYHSPDIKQTMASYISISDEKHRMINMIIERKTRQAKWLTNIEHHIIHMAVTDRTFLEVIKYLIDEITKLIEGKVDYHDLIMSKMYYPPYKSDTFYMKLYVEHLIDSGRQVSPGDQVEYLVIDVPSQVFIPNSFNRVLLGDRLIHPDQYAKALESGNPYKIDYMYYLENHFAKPLDRILKCYEHSMVKYVSVTYRYSLRHKVITIDTPVKLMTEMLNREQPLNKLIEKMKVVDSQSE